MTMAYPADLRPHYPVSPGPEMPPQPYQPYRGMLETVGTHAQTRKTPESHGGSLLPNGPGLRHRRSMHGCRRRGERIVGRHAQMSKKHASFILLQ